jgi:hypothetical protein
MLSSLYKIKKSIPLSLLILSHCLNILSQKDDQLFIPRDIQAAYEKGTRSFDGVPGKNYFQNRVDYEIDVIVDPDSFLIKGKEKIIFYNQSGRDLRYLVIKTYHDVFRKGAVRARKIETDDAGIGMDIKKLSINSEAFDPKDPETYYGKTPTNFIVPCRTRKNEQSVIEIEWHTRIPKKTHERFGMVDSSSLFMGYWFPQLAVFDDINGWDIFDYNNLNEMYNEFGNFNVHISVPENYIIWATGVLQNPDEVLADEVLKRFIKSKKSSEPVRIITEKDLRKANPLTKKGWNTWSFSAENVNDFAFGMSDHHLWSASSVLNPDGFDIHLHTAWLESSENYNIIPGYFNWMIETMSDSIIGYPFPYSSMTIFNGLDGMEFPMIVNDTEMDSHGGTYFLSTHEVVHSYFPFLVGTNQRRHGWLDEGLVTMLGVDVHTRKLNEYNFRDTYLEWYPLIAGTQQDVPSIVNSVYLTDHIYQQHEYVRPTIAFWTLQDILGKEMFQNCLKEFISRWEYKHPTPYDLFFTFNDVSEENLNWFFQSWFVEFGYPDLGISGIVDENKSQMIEIKNIGGMPFPSELEIVTMEKGSIKIEIDARVWKNNNKSFLVPLPENIHPVKFVLNTENYPDSNLENNTFLPENLQSEKKTKNESSPLQLKIVR